MTNKETRKLARQKINEGKSHQETFEELLQETKKPAEGIAKIVRFIPTLENRRKYKTVQTILIIVLALTILIKMAAGLSIVMEKGIHWSPIIFLLPIINIALLYGVATYQGQYYRLVVILSIFSLINGLLNTAGEAFDPLILIDLGIAGVLIGLGIYLNAKMVSKCQTIKEKYLDQEGEPQLRKRIEMLD